jgi:cytochrome c oxidase subunit II
LLSLTLVACQEQTQQRDIPPPPPLPSGNEPQAMPPAPGNDATTNFTDVPAATGGATSGNTVEVNLEAFEFAFNPATIRAKQGDTVIVHIKSTEGNHGFGVQGYNVDSGEIEEGQTKTVQFVADKTGTFRFFCNVPCGSGHRSMNGQLIVE